MAPDADFKKIERPREKLDVSGMCHFSCPYVGTRHDRGTAMGFPHAENRCYRHGEAVEIELHFQRSFCLSDGYESCERYLQPKQAPALEEPPARLSERRRLAVPAALILVLLLALIAAPGLVRLGGGTMPDSPFDLEPVYALFQDRSPASEQPAPAPQDGREQDSDPAGEGLDDRKANELSGSPAEGTTQPAGPRGAGSFRAVSYSGLE